MKKSKLKKTIDGLAFGLASGMKVAEEQFFTGLGAVSDGDVCVVSQKEQGNKLMQSLLKGEVTQEVKDLRYRMYKIDEAVDGQKTIGNVADGGGVTFKYKKLKPLVEESEDDCEVVIVQNIKKVTTSIGDDINGNHKDGKYKPEYQLKIKRDFLCRFLIEKFAEKVVIKKLPNEQYQLDIYTTIYEDEFDSVANSFTKEVKKVSNGDHRNELLDFTEVSFFTKDAYGTSDGAEFSFKINNFKNCINYLFEDNGLIKNSGFYVLKFDVTPIVFNLKLTEKFFEEELEEKYKNKEKKNIETTAFLKINEDGTQDITTGPIEREKIYCDVCGREIGYHYDDNGEKILTPIFDDYGNKILNDDGKQKMEEIFDETLFWDYKITKVDYGVGMCVDCLLKKMED